MARFTLPRDLYHGKGAMENLKNLKGSKAVIVVGGSAMKKNGFLQKAESYLKEAGMEVKIIEGVEPDPSVTTVMNGAAVMAEFQPDWIVAIGGGAAIDCAKAVGARVAYPKRTVNQLGGKLKVWRKLPTLIAIPTTAGTGSEATLASMITDSSTHRKYAIMSFPLIPHYAVLDASLTYSLPPHLTASTGVDALTHAVEAFIGRSTTNETRKLALEATKLVFENVEKAYLNGNNHAARENMLYAAHKAGIAFSKSYVGYIHALAHSLGGKYGTPHGLANAVLMPYVLQAYGKKVYKKLHRLGIAAGVATKEDAPAAGAIKFINAVKALNADMNIPDKLSGIKKEDIEALTKHAEKEANPLYPVPVLMTKKELESFYYQVADWSE